MVNEDPILPVPVKSHKLGHHGRVGVRGVRPHVQPHPFLLLHRRIQRTARGEAGTTRDGGGFGLLRLLVPEARCGNPSGEPIDADVGDTGDGYSVQNRGFDGVADGGEEGVHCEGGERREKEVVGAVRAKVCV